MVRRRSLRAALASAAAALVVTAVPATSAQADDPDLTTPAARVAAAEPTRAQVATRQAARKAADEATPLTVTIETLSPSAIPARGRVRVAGTVTNADSVPWLTVNVYSFISPEPMTTRAELEDAVLVDESETVGERITDLDNYSTIDSIEPGESKQFTFTVDVDLLAADAPGVYWFGVHALGQRSGEGRDELFVADGRARTFLPMVPKRRTGEESVAIVVPIRRDISFAEDGSLVDLDKWTVSLGEEGRLRRLIELAATAGDRTVSWVVDPATIEAVRQLASGNPPRSLAATLDEGEEDGEPTGDASPGELPADEPTEEPSQEDGEDGSGEPDQGDQGDEADDPTTAELPDSLDDETRAAAQAARDWLARLRAAMDVNDEVMGLPYGDLDVSAAVRHDESAYELARSRGAGPLPGIQLPTRPVIASPRGYLSPDAIDVLGPEQTVLVGDQMFAEAPAVASVDGHRLVVTSAGAASGGPGPGDRRSIIAMRQRLLSEAAVRFLRPTRAPLVVLLPYDWAPSASSTFFSGLDLDWIDLTSVAGATEGVTAEVVASEDVAYPERQSSSELDAANFAAARLLRETGESLQSMLTLNNEIGRTVSDESLTAISYSSRLRPDSVRVAADRSRRWIEERLDRVAVSAPPAVTLSSINGTFPATISNDLDEPVTVRLQADADDGELDVPSPPEVELVAKGTATVLLDARTDTAGVHEVTLVVTDKTGRPLGGSDELSIRSARVSNIIWLFLATGIGLLFGTIAFRLFRRSRSARREKVPAG